MITAGDALKGMPPQSCTPAVCYRSQSGENGTATGTNEVNLFQLQFIRNQLQYILLAGAARAHAAPTEALIAGPRKLVLQPAGVICMGFLN